jgi:hypothetical protein
MMTLAFVEGIADSGLEFIFKHCSVLHYLDTYGMKNITGSSFSCIPQYAHKLNYLVIEHSSNFGKEEHLNAMLKLNSKVRVYRTHIWQIGETDV